MQLFIDEFLNLLEHLGIHHNYDVIGHSWGGILASELATAQLKGLRRVILANTPASMELWVEAANRLRLALPKDVQVRVWDLEPLESELISSKRRRS